MKTLQNEIQRMREVLTREPKLDGYHSCIFIPYVEGVQIASQLGGLHTDCEGLHLKYFETWNGKQLTVYARLR